MASSPFEEACRLRITTAPVRIDTIQFHPLQRKEDAEHVRTLAKAFSIDTVPRWMHPIEVVLSSPVPSAWKEELRASSRLPELPKGVHLVCIDGRHRISAGLCLISETKHNGKKL
jgi:hypothetical protein